MTDLIERVVRRASARVRAYAPPPAVPSAAVAVPAARPRASRVRPYAASALAHIRIGVPDWHAEFAPAAAGAFAGVGR
ncbi:hypothetical protein ACFQZ2_02065 [Streptomonospora algeriensis]|uniref:Uncharacterized protein n=1 Tax=Streptomonospora algeriensis TaxID=995084 RepID=A0ABW3BCG5_9ACTN